MSEKFLDGIKKPQTNKRTNKKQLITMVDTLQSWLYKSNCWLIRNTKLQKYRLNVCKIRLDQWKNEKVKKSLPVTHSLYPFLSRVERNQIWPVQLIYFFFHICCCKYSNGTITGEGLQMLTYARRPSPLSSDGSLTCQTFRKVFSEGPQHSHTMPSVWQWSCHFLL